MATNTANLQDAATTITTGFESIVIVDTQRSIRGGRTLDTSAFVTANAAITYLAAGHIIIEETATGNYKPMPIASSALPNTGVAFGSLPTGHTYAGILINTVPVAKPFAGILVAGTINPLAMPYVVSSVLTALKTALTFVDFRSDAQ